MGNIKKLLNINIIILLGFNSAGVLALNNPPPAYRTDPSKPEPTSHICPSEANTIPVSGSTQTAWESYSSPLSTCTQGHAIIPSNGNDLFSALFHNNSRVNITMAIQGWNKNICQVNFSEATHVMYCQFNKSELKAVVNSILAASQFDPSGNIAQLLSSNCSPMPTMPIA